MALSITGERDDKGRPHDMGHTADAFWGISGAEDVAAVVATMLERLDITVEAEESNGPG